MRSEILENVLREIPLDIRLKSAISAYAITAGGGQLFIPADEEYIPEGDTIPLAEQIMNKNAEIIAGIQPILDIIDQELKDWVEDGGVIQLN